MNIGYFADGHWSHRALEKIIKNKCFKIAFIVPRFDTQDPVLRAWAKKLRVDYLPIENINCIEAIEKLKKYDAELFVSMSFNQILKSQILNAAPLGFINCHAGGLPFYRGRNILNWALINGESRFGVTVHYIDEGIDTGDIIIQKFSKIELTDDYNSTLEKAVVLCEDALYDALLLIEEGGVQCTLQKSIHPVGFYCGRRREGDEWINWDWTSERLYNFIRGITTPGPCGRTWKGNQELAILKAKLIPNAPDYIGTIGEVIGKNEEGVVVKTQDSSILITEVADVLSGELCNSRCPKYYIGTRFGLNLWERVQHLESRISELEYKLKTERAPD